MTFERCHDAGLITHLARRSWDRPEMLGDGADLSQDWEIPATAQCFIGREGQNVFALFIGYQQSNACIDLHLCLTPECRGGKAIRAVREFFSWLAWNTQYRKAIGCIPAYNRPMLFVARAAGMNLIGINRESTMRGGKLEDQVIMERRLA